MNENKLFHVPERTPNYGWTDFDFCRFWSYLILRGEEKGFYINKKICEECGSSEYLEAHHIIPFSEFGRHNEDNLIILCNECHNKVHHKNLKIEREGVLDYEWYNQYQILMILYRLFGRNKLKREIIDKLIFKRNRINLTKERFKELSKENYLIKDNL